MANHMVGAVYLFLQREDKVLLMERQNTGYADGLFSVVAGHMEPGESPTQAMIREAFEEVGIMVRSDQIRLCGIMQRPSTNDEQERIDFFFSCSEWVGEIQNKEPEKCGELRWVHQDRWPDNRLLYVQQAFRRSLENESLWFDDEMVEKSA